MARSGECTLLTLQSQYAHYGIVLVQVNLLSNCRFMKQIGSIVVVFEDIAKGATKHTKEAVTVVHVVNLEGFLWEDAEENVCTEHASSVSVTWSLRFRQSALVQHIATLRMSAVVSCLRSGSSHGNSSLLFQKVVALTCHPDGVHGSSKTGWTKRSCWRIGSEPIVTHSLRL